MKLKYVIVIIIIGIVIAAGFVFYPYFQLNMASKAYEKGQLDTTISICNSLEKKGFKQAALYLIRGKAFLFSRNAHSALRDLNKSIQLDPNNWEPYIHIGYIQLANKEYTNAEKSYSKVIELNPKSIEAYNNRAAIYIELKKLSAARDDYVKALEINPDSPEVYFNLAKLYDDTNNFNLASKNYNLFLQHSKSFMTDLLDEANKRIVALEKLTTKEKLQINKNVVLSDIAVFYDFENDNGNTATSNK